MEELVRIQKNINIETKKLGANQIQAVLIRAKHQRNTKENVEHWNNILESLLKHLNTGFTKMDDQMLCGTCFFSAITLSNKQEFYLQRLKHLIDEEILLRTQGIKEGLNTLQIVSMIYGMFQSTFLITKDIDNTRTLQSSNLLSSSFNLLVLIAYEYSLYTYPAFKIMSSYKKIVGTQYQDSIFSKENQISLLNLVNHNWENPITGVRDLNREIFQVLIANIDEVMLQEITAEINSFYWNKAKYLMLTVVIENYHGNITKLLSDNMWHKGLIDNLHKPGLVSAVTDMYFAVLGKLKSAEHWSQIFLNNILQILNGSCSRAIENFNNYWVLITFKKFPQLLDILLGGLMKCNDTEQRLHSMLFLVKQGNKIGIPSTVLEDNSIIDKLVLYGIEHCNTQIRKLAFDILCIPNHKTMPSDKQYELILNYVQDNINSDCTVLRISMLKSFDTFMGELHILFRNLRIKEGDGIDKLVDFCKDIQKIIVNSLKSNGNYQRNITTIKVCNTFIGCVSEIPKKRRQQTRDSNVILIDVLRNRNSWILLEEPFLMKLISLLRDPSDDIRDNVTNLLLLHYHAELRKSNVENDYYSFIVEEALKCIKSKFFYNVSCGQSMFYLVVNLLLKDECDHTIFKSVEDVFNFGYNELKTEYELKRTITKTIEEGKQLHSFISILQVVLEASLNSKKIHIPDETVDDLLNMIHDIANQFYLEQGHSTLTDFSEMSDMVEAIIEEAGYKSNDKDDAKISGMHQMVLNCLWHNVKTSSQLAALLVQYNADDVERCSKCLMIITRVLETSRHKGAIEAAGVSLGKAIQFLTSLPEDSSTSSLPQTLLKSKLQMLITEASKMASITRRGAGLSIMVHRIVSSDMRKGKPLFHYFMKTILNTCQNTEDIPDTQDVTNLENQVDLPKAILIHFLTKIVTDSSLASDMMFYSAELAELAFSNLISPHWQIRNAALQLYGALVQKLVGQKKASGTDDETIATVGCDELRTHSPKLWSYITEQLRNSHCNKLETHSNLIPILNMLANSAKRYNFSFDLEVHEVADEKLLYSLVTILDSPIHTVRRLTAKCIFNMFPFELIQGLFVNMRFQSENMLHGALLLFKLCYQYQYYQHTFSKEIVHLEKMFRILLERRRHSYWSKEVLESAGCNDKTMALENILSEAKKNTNVLAMPFWLNTCVRNCIHNSSWEDIPQYLETLLECSDYECYWEFLVEKLNSDIMVPDEVLLKIAQTILLFENNFNSGVTWKILYEVSLRVKLTNVNIEQLLEALENGVTYKLRYIVPFAARVLASVNMSELQQRSLQYIIFKLSDPETADFDMRHIAVLANNEIANHFDKLTDEVKMISIKTAIYLLQDEDEDIRSACVNYYKNIKNIKYAVHSNICLHKILDKNFLLEIFSDPKMINILCDNILNFESTSLHKIDEDNPFANYSKNMYLEVNVLNRLVENLKFE